MNVRFDMSKWVEKYDSFPSGCGKFVFRVIPGDTILGEERVTYSTVWRRNVAEVIKWYSEMGRFDDRILILSPEQSIIE